MKEESFHTLGSYFTGRDRGVGRGEGLEPRRRAQQQGCRGQSGEIPVQRIGANQHSPTWEACLLTHWGGWGLGAEAQASELRAQGEDWGWLYEDSLKGAGESQLARRESGKKSGPAKEARDHCFSVCQERGFLPHVPTKGRALPNQAPQTGASCGYQLRPQRRAWNANTAAVATKNLCASTGHYQPPPPLPPGACAARHCQDPEIQGELPWENTWCTSGCCNVMLASAAAGSPCIPIMTTVPLPLPSLSEQESTNQPLL